MRDSMNVFFNTLFKNKRRHRRFILAMLCLSICVATTVYGMMRIPAVGRENHNPLVEAASAYALNGDTISLHVLATAEDGDPETVFLLSMQGYGAGLSDEYYFNESNEMGLTAESGNTVTLHRETDAAGSFRYWFSLPMNTSEKLTLNCKALPPEEPEAPSEKAPERPEYAPPYEPAIFVEEEQNVPSYEEPVLPNNELEPTNDAIPEEISIETDTGYASEPEPPAVMNEEAILPSDEPALTDKATPAETSGGGDAAPSPEAGPATVPDGGVDTPAAEIPASESVNFETAPADPDTGDNAEIKPDTGGVIQKNDEASYIYLSSASGNTLNAAQEALGLEQPTQYIWFPTEAEVATAQQQEKANDADENVDAPQTPDADLTQEAASQELTASGAALQENTLHTVADIEAAIDDLPELSALEQMDGVELVNALYEVVTISDAISDLSEEDYESIDEALLLKFLELSDHFSGGASALSLNGTVGTINWSYDDVTQTLTLTGSGTVPANFLLSLPTTQGCNTPSKLIIGGGITKIGNDAFNSETSLTQVSIGNGVTSIGSNAFYQCNVLTSLTLPQDGSMTTIGGSAFSFCRGLTSLSLPGSITDWGDLAFSQCSALTSLTLGNGLQKIGTRVFFECTSLGTVTLPSSIKTIGLAAFSGCSALQSVTLNEGLEQIYSQAFLGSGLRGTITIPSTVRSIASKAFAIADPSLADISVTQPSQLTALGYQFGTSSSFNGWDYYPGLKSFIISSLNSGGNIQLTEHPNYNGHQDPDSYDDVKHSDNVESTWLTKSAKWTDLDMTEAELRIDFSANNRLTDYIFVMDHTASMAAAPENGSSQTAKIYTLASLMTKVNSALLNTSGYDNRVAVINFNDAYPFVYTHGFTSSSATANAYLTSDIVYGSTNYNRPLEATMKLIDSRSGTEALRPVKVIFLSDGAPNSGVAVDGIFGKNEADTLKANGIPIYGILFDAPANASMSYICDKVYYASDDVALNVAFNEALNNTIGISNKLVDVIEDEYFTIPNDAVLTVKDPSGNVISNAATWYTDENGKQIIEWNLADLSPCINYTLTLRNLQLNTNSSGNYPNGDLPTNDDDDTKKATVKDVGGRKVNDVDTPVLSRGGYQLPATGGPGLWQIYACGFLLLSSSLIILVKQRWRKQGGDRSY